MAWPRTAPRSRCRSRRQEPPISRPTILLYDWDNTLVDGWAGVAAALNAVFTVFAMPHWTAEETRARVRLSLRESFPAMFGDRWDRGA